MVAHAPVGSKALLDLLSTFVCCLFFFHAQDKEKNRNPERAESNSKPPQMETSSNGEDIEMDDIDKSGRCIHIVVVTIHDQQTPYPAEQLKAIPFFQTAMTKRWNPPNREPIAPNTILCHLPVTNQSISHATLSFIISTANNENIIPTTMAPKQLVPYLMLADFLLFPVSQEMVLRWTENMKCGMTVGDYQSIIRECKKRDGVIFDELTELFGERLSNTLTLNEEKIQHAMEQFAMRDQNVTNIVEFNAGVLALLLLISHASIANAILRDRLAQKTVPFSAENITTANQFHRSCIDTFERALMGKGGGCQALEVAWNELKRNMMRFPRKDWKSVFDALET